MFTISVSGVLLLFLIHHSTLKGVDGQNIDVNTLARIITFFEHNYKKVDEHGQELQYAAAINVPTDQCGSEFTPSQNNFLLNENALCVKCGIANNEYPVYEGTDLIAAGVKNMGEYFIHSERLLLNTGERPVAPMQNLLNKRHDSCTILYSFNSPCADICLNEKNEYNVLQGLKNWSLNHISIKALVFKKIWRLDAGKKEHLRNALQRIADYVPLYRCVNDNECFSCGGRNNVPIDMRCLTN